MARVVLAMSGGVDSSVAAHMLRAVGHEVIGLFMRHGEESTACATPTGKSAAVGAATVSPLPIVTARPGHKQGCCSASDAADARRIADQLDIPFYALDFREDFGAIIDYFVDEYRDGRTPNPCVVCNNWLKFGRLVEYADSVGAEFIATGHHARIERPENERSARLLRGADPDKDQSYVLFGIERDVLPRVLFPVGEHAKPRIRELAAELRLRVADKPDSQEICFVPDGDYAQFVRRRAGDDDDRTGEVVTTDGTVVGHHPGIEHFTVGQRKGLGVALGSPRFVVRLDVESRRVVIGTRDDLARTTLSACRANWLIDPPTEPFECQVKIRYRSQPVSARVIPSAGDRFDVEFDEPTYGVAPGQAAVCYQGDRVLGGGWIE